MTTLGEGADRTTQGPVIGGAPGELEMLGLHSVGLLLAEVNGEYEGIGVRVATRAALRAVKCDVANQTPAVPAASTTTAKDRECRDRGDQAV